MSDHAPDHDLETEQVQYQRAYYDQHFAKREGAMREQLAHPMFQSFYDRLAIRVFDNAPPAAGDGVRLLECGCGEGLLATALRRVADKRGIDLAYTGTDLSESALGLASEHVTGDLIPGDAMEVLAGLPTSSQDIVVIKNLLHHLDEPDTLLTEAARIVAPSGRVVVVEACLGAPQFWVFSGFAPKRERYFFYGRRRNLTAIKAAGLRILDTSKFSWLPYELAFAIRFDWFRKLLGTRDPAKLDKVSAVDDRLTKAVPALASYIVWVTSPAPPPLASVPSNGTAEGSTNNV